MHRMYRDVNSWRCTGLDCIWSSDGRSQETALLEHARDHAIEEPELPLGPLPPRLSREGMLMKMAYVVSERSTCSRLHVGAIIARDNRAVSAGYNGNPAGMPHCEHVDDEPCSSAVHAEANAIAFAARHGTPTEGAEMFTTHQPCLKCAQLIVNCGIARVVYDIPYRLLDGLDLLNAVGVATMMKSPYE